VCPGARDFQGERQHLICPTLTALGIRRGRPPNWTSNRLLDAYTASIIGLQAFCLVPAHLND
jgi:hypothetical protein